MAKETPTLKSREVARILDLSPDEVVALAHQGKLKAIKEGRFWRFHPADVVTYKREQDEKDRQ